MDIEHLSLKHNAQNILRLTRRMLAQAQNNEWDGLAKIEVDRGDALKSLFAHPDIDLSLPLLSDILYEVLALDRECIHLTEKARFALLQNIRHQSKGDHALCVYREHSPG